MPFVERDTNVHALKKSVAGRVKSDPPGRGGMHLPAMPLPGAATSRVAFAKMMTLYAFELTAERYLNDEWVPIRLRNETWDGWIACEVGRESLKPDREELWADQLPEWAVAKQRGQGQIGRAHV